MLFPDYIFETSWEVCNKVGGIYTVLSTRAKTLQDKIKDRIISLVLTAGKRHHPLILKRIRSYLLIGSRKQFLRGYQ